MTVGLRSAEVFVLLDSDDEDKDPHEHDAAFALDPNRVLSAYSRGAELNDVELEKVLMQVRFRIGWSEIRINYNTPMKDLSSDEQASQHEIKQAIRFYNRQIRDGEEACKVEVIGMVDGTGEDWEKGQSQTEHERFMNIEGYK